MLRSKNVCNKAGDFGGYERKVVSTNGKGGMVSLTRGNGLLKRTQDRAWRFDRASARARGLYRRAILEHDYGYRGTGTSCDWIGSGRLERTRA